MKKIGEEELEKRVAYEVSVSKLEIPAEEGEASETDEAVF
jgi:hypothetical protein